MVLDLVNPGGICIRLRMMLVRSETCTRVQLGKPLEVFQHVEFILVDAIMCHLPHRCEFNHCNEMHEVDEGLMLLALFAEVDTSNQEINGAKGLPLVCG